MTTITIERSLIEQSIESFVGYRREMRLMIGDEESEPCDAEKALRAALAAPATDDRHAQELLAQDITLQNMAERHAQELCAYQITVDKLRAERKPMTDGQIAKLLDRVRMQWVSSPPTYEAAPAFVRAVEAHHGIGEKP